MEAGAASVFLLYVLYVLYAWDVGVVACFEGTADGLSAAGFRFVDVLFLLIASRFVFFFVVVLFLLTFLLFFYLLCTWYLFAFGQGASVPYA